MDRKGIVDKYLQTHLSDVEGNSDQVYQDHKGIPTIGTGVNLKSPSAQKSILNLGYEPQKVQTGEAQLSPDELNKVHADSLNDIRNVFETIKSQSFPKKELNEAQEAALLSMTYNSPKLLGPSLRQHLNNNQDLDVMREMVLNSNKDNVPGVQLRRIKEAELYGGPLDFQQMIKTLKPEEKKQIYELLTKIDNDEQRGQVIAKYGQFNPDYQAPLEKPAFHKLANLFKGK